jgi:hypothetical protein
VTESNDLTREDVVIYLLMKALIKAIRVSAEPGTLTDDEVTEVVNGLIGLAASELPNAALVLKRIDIGGRCDLAMDRLHIQAPNILRLIPGGKGKKATDE